MGKGKYTIDQLPLVDSEPQPYDEPYWNIPGISPKPRPRKTRSGFFHIKIGRANKLARPGLGLSQWLLNGIQNPGRQWLQLLNIKRLATIVGRAVAVHFDKQLINLFPTMWTPSRFRFKVGWHFILH
jgi:hypothetical protein